MKQLSKFLVAAGILSNTVLAQNKTLSLQECIDHALKHNENLRTANLNIAYQREYKKASTEMPKTTAVYTQGQFNSIYKYDNNITLSQTIPNPFVFTSHNALGKAQIKSGEYRLEATKAELIFQVKSSYYSLLYSTAVHKILLKEDSIYDNFGKTVAQNFKEGKGTFLEKTTAETQLMEIRNQVSQSEEDINNHRIELQTLMNRDAEFEIKEEDFEKNFLSVAVDTGRLAEHPLLKHLQQQIKVNDKIKSLEAAKALPDFIVSYFNQSIYGPANVFGEDYFLTTANRLQGFQLGIAIPVWFYPYKAKVKAAGIQSQLAESDYNYHATVLQGQYRQAVTLYLKYRNSINYYQTNVLGNLKLIIEQSLKSYDSKDFNYNDYLEAISRALSIQRNYLNVIHQNNLNVLKIEYLLAK